MTEEFIYKCWKCKLYRIRAEHDQQDQLTLKCPRCRVTLLQTRRAPGVQTDSTFMSGSHVDDGWGNDNASRMAARAAARAAGVNPEGKKYLPGLAKKRFDPAAWVSGKGDVIRRCKEEGWGCNGSVSVAAPTLDEPNPLEKPYRVAPHLVEREVNRIVAERNGDVTPRERAELVEATSTRMSGIQE